MKKQKKKITDEMFEKLNDPNRPLFSEQTAKKIMSHLNEELRRKSRRVIYMYEIFADLHVHIGRSENGKPIKITAAKTLNFANIAKECADRKGINVVGIIDCASPYVIEDIENFLKTGDAYELRRWGIIYKDKVCIILGSEVETSEKGRNGNKGAAHNLCYFPHLSDIKGFLK